MSRQEDLMALAASVSVLFARGKNAEELAFLSDLFMLVGQSLASMAGAQGYAAYLAEKKIFEKS